MKPHRNFHPDLQASELEDRLLPVIANLSVIVLTTGGYVLMTPFPGAMSYITNAPGGGSIPTTFFMTGSGGISSIQPGNITGIPGLAGAATTGSGGGAGATITVGVVIAFGIAVSTVLGRFVIPIYYVLAERISGLRKRSVAPAQPGPSAKGDGRGARSPEEAFAEADQS